MADEDVMLQSTAERTDGDFSPGHRPQEGETDRSPARSEGSNRDHDSDDGSEKENVVSPTKRKRSSTPPALKDEAEETDGYDLPRPKRKKERHMWTLPPDLAGYFNDFVKEFYDDDDLRDEDGNCIKEKHPVPENIQKVPKLDTFVEEDWRDKKYLVAGDGDVARIQQRIQDVMGPLSKVWLTWKT